LSTRILAKKSRARIFRFTPPFNICRARWLETTAAATAAAAASTTATAATATTAAATTTAAAAAITAAATTTATAAITTTTAATAFFAGARDADRHGATVEFIVVEQLNGFGCFCITNHFNEPETFGTTSLAIQDQRYFFYLTCLGKELAQVVL
jgi:hypothetical protein